MRRSPTSGALDVGAFARGGGMMQAINVTPMIDVMLVLLIIFMVVTPILTAGFHADLPAAEFLQPRPDDPSRVTLGIDRDGRLFLDQKPITDAELPAALARIFRNRTTDRILIVKADRHLRWQQVLDVLATAREAGVRLVGAVGEPRPQPSTPRPERRARSGAVDSDG
jgi:biopolymer transport protein TolR